MAQSNPATDDRDDDTADDRPFSPPEFARDAHAPDGDDDLVLVLDVLDETASEHAIAALAGQTVAEANDCDPDDAVVMAVYEDSISLRLDDWIARDVLEMYRDGTLRDHRLRAYAFPASRLRRIEVE